MDTKMEHLLTKRLQRILELKSSTSHLQASHSQRRMDFLLNFSFLQSLCHLIEGSIVLRAERHSHRCVSQVFRLPVCSWSERIVLLGAMKELLNFPFFPLALLSICHHLHSSRHWWLSSWTLPTLTGEINSLTNGTHTTQWQTLSKCSISESNVCQLTFATTC